MVSNSNSNSDHPASRIKSNERVLKDIAKILYKLIAVLAVLLALNYTETANKFSKQQYTIYFISSIIVVVIFINRRWKNKNKNDNLNGNTLESEMEKLFKKLDTDGDGKISISDLRSITGKLEIGDDVDGIDGGSITLQEFIELSTTSYESEEEIENLKSTFSVYDIDGDGFITAKELNTLMRSIGQECSLDECERIIGRVDSDGDGRIDFEDFRIMMMMGSRHNRVEHQT
ncbi:putative EF-hand domain pair protein [Medicago truncatula]|uniref:EF-hand pair protein n=1 Tax=Medicago truncatula TaxID=3880 RepID=G7J9L5_MEDTR|nr:probable calcium-binding protein CML25 isoform X1 [Medicago truncatula]AES71854.1 EF-hand pair protein [Medicago truncatula]RHN69111.1 putative EF-hand domain pair protein [Medicago truncatula]